MRPTRVLNTLGVEQAVAAQFRLTDIVTRQLGGTELMSAGDYGYGTRGDQGRPWFTAAVESILGEFFEAEAAALVWGAGTGAVRAMLMGSVQAGARILLHTSPPYATTDVSLAALGLERIVCDFNHRDALLAALREQPDAALIQHTPQAIGDVYDPLEIIKTVKERSPTTMVLMDENYAALRVQRLGCSLGADASAFSVFKLHGPPGIGCVVGSRSVVDEIHRQNSSGGSKIPGPIALESLRRLIGAPVTLALQGRTVASVVRQVNDAITDRPNEFPMVLSAHESDVNERSVLIELDRPLGREVVNASWKHGGAPYPVGGESDIEIAPLFYRLARTFVRADPTLMDSTFRINPNRCGPETVLRILKASLNDVQAKKYTGPEHQRVVRDSSS